ncbi:uncharacterized protein LOC133850087 [Drosophila sulfurigaster albostrigata]|uniref:uncharacterized protein LOC133850087 n=1 Tax=Drosophila sulfurigaster albostrigata TaxID=89887 RepID=UPI002D21E883|nr:uncharacterized protein LOC133850087 [Drosophila sulfurigaster albostrigata]
MDYVNNYAQIGGYGMCMPPPQLYYPEMNGGKGYEQGSAMDVLNPRYESSYYKDERKRNYYDGGDYNQGGGHKAEPIDLNHFYDGGDFKHPSDRDNRHDVDYGSQHYFANSPSAYRRYAQENRRCKEMHARNGLYSPRDSSYRHNTYPNYSDDITRGSSGNSYWQ